jgi:hypothetical protein
MVGNAADHLAQIGFGIEAAIRPLALGRKNYLFAGSDGSALLVISSENEPIFSLPLGQKEQRIQKRIQPQIADGLMGSDSRPEVTA